jgi:hypothetical protein
MSTFGHRSNVITQTRQAASALLAAYDQLRALQNSWDNGVKGQIIDATGSDPKAEDYAANDFAGHEGLVKSDINQVLGVALTALTTFVVSADGKKLEDIRI